MTRTRRVSIELVRREFRLSLTSRATAAAEARSDTPARDDTDVPANTPRLAVCLVCASPGFALSLGDGEEPAIVQRALEKHGVHTQRSSASELLVCRRSFELQIAAFEVTNRSTQEPQLASNSPSSRGRGDSNV